MRRVTRVPASGRPSYAPNLGTSPYTLCPSPTAVTGPASANFCANIPRAFAPALLEAGRWGPSTREMQEDVETKEELPPNRG